MSGKKTPANGKQEVLKQTRIATEVCISSMLSEEQGKTSETEAAATWAWAQGPRQPATCPGMTAAKFTVTALICSHRPSTTDMPGTVLSCVHVIPHFP